MGRRCPSCDVLPEIPEHEIDVRAAGRGAGQLGVDDAAAGFDRGVVAEIVGGFENEPGGVHIDAIGENYDFWTTDQFDSSGYPKLHFIENEYADDPTNWWVPNRACVEAMLRSAGFSIAAHPEDEVYLCKRSERPPCNGSAHPLGEIER